jgi:glycosyltransferase involved in cell wall biosynthesis
MTADEPKLSVIIPTRGRPASLSRAVRSLFRQTGLELSGIELVVVDNDAGGGAEPVAARLAITAPFELHYVREPHPGVASARNAGLAKARAPLIAFLDDDEEASAGWLAALLDVRERFDADVVFGPVRGRAPDRVQRHRDYLERFFSREGPAEAQLLEGYFGCGCSLIRRAALPDPCAPFPLSQNQFGGEDDRLFQAMKARGVRFAWAPEAWVWEHPDPDRLTLGYALQRAFAYGQGPSWACLSRRPPDVPGIAYWMAVGAGQTVVFGAMALLKWLAHTPDRAFALDRAARGLGKLLWFPPFKRKFYGLP